MSPRLPKYFKVLLSTLRSYFSTSGVLSAANGGTGTASAFVGGVLAAAYGGTATANTAAIANGSVKITCADAAPSNPTADDLWYETDTNILWFWNGTYWLSTQVFSEGVSNTALAAGQTTYFQIEPVQGVQYDLFIVSVTSALYVLTTNDGSNYWTANVQQLNTAAGGSILGTINTSAIGANTFTAISANIGTHLDLSALGTDAAALQIDLAKTSAPGALYGHVKLNYRLAHL